MRNYWNERYDGDEYAYGKEPNAFLRAVLGELNLTGTVLFPAEGEGRNAVYAATKGLQVYAYDISATGRAKAMKLADECGVSIDYQVGTLEDLPLGQMSYDAVVLIFAHFPPLVWQRIYRQLAALVKPGGYIILEGFSKKNLQYRADGIGVGGPAAIEMLFSRESIAQNFPQFTQLLLEEKEVVLNEGAYHVGKSSVIRFVGRKE